MKSFEYIIETAQEGIGKLGAAASVLANDATLTETQRNLAGEIWDKVVQIDEILRTILGEDEPDER